MPEVLAFFTLAGTESAPGAPPSLPGERLLQLGQSLAAWAQARPWLLGLAAAALFGAIGGWQGLRAALLARRHRHLTRHAQQIVILPPPVVEPGGARMWWANLAGLLRPTPWQRLLRAGAHIGLEYRWSGRQLQIVIWVPGTLAPGPVAAAVRAAWPGSSTRVEDATAPLPTAALRARSADPGGRKSARDAVLREAGAAVTAAMPPWYPLATSAQHDSDPLRALIAAGSDLRTSEAACVQILARVAAPRAVARARAGASALKTGQAVGGPLSLERALRAALTVTTDLLTPSRRGPAAPGRIGVRAGGDPMRERDVRPGLDKLAGGQWEVAIRVGVVNTAPVPARTSGPGPLSWPPRGHLAFARPAPDALTQRLRTQVRALSAALAVHDARNRLRRVRLARPCTVLGARVLRAGFLLSGEELATLAGLPLDVAVAGLDRARARAVPAPITVPAGGRNTKPLGRAQVGQHPVSLPVADAREHVHVLGSTGAGKSTLLTHLILDDIRARRATILIDPKGDLARDVLARLPAGALQRLILIDPDQPGGSANFNPLQLRRGADPDLIADNIVSIFSAIFQRAWGPRIDDVVRVSCLTLMRHRNPTLANIAPLLNDKQFRAPFTVGFDDPAGLQGFWQWYESTPPQLRAQVIGPVLARLRSFLLRDFVRATIGPYRSSFDMNQVLNNGGILIARLPKGQLGEDTSRLLGSLIFASVWQAATARAHLSDARRRDASVYVDEAHNVLNLSGTVSDMLAEARGYRLSMVLAHQHLAQLPRDTQLALSANARTKIFFNCSPEDAVQLARHTRPELDEHDLSHLDAYIAAARLVIANRETAAFTLATNPPPPETGALARVRAQIARTASTGRDHEPSNETGGQSSSDTASQNSGENSESQPAPDRDRHCAQRDSGGRQPRREPDARVPGPSQDPRARTGAPTTSNPQAGTT
jgi:hypothetical protein